MSLKAKCPRCSKLLDVAVAVVLADPRSGECVAAQGTSPRTVISAGGAGITDLEDRTATEQGAATTGSVADDATVTAFPNERGFDDDEAPVP